MVSAACRRMTDNDDKAPPDSEPPDTLRNDLPPWQEGRIYTHADIAAGRHLPACWRNGHAGPCGADDCPLRTLH